MKFSVKHTFVLFLLALLVCSNANARAMSSTEVFVSQQLSSFGLAGTPWESATSIDEERSRAWMHALHEAYDAILNLPLMEGKLVREILSINPGLMPRLGVVVLSAPRSFYQKDASGLIRCRVDVPLSGSNSLRSALYLAALRPQSAEPVSFLASWSAGIKIEADTNPPPFKRLVVDVRNYHFKPSLFPRFFDQSGMLIFQESMVPAPHRFSRPAVRFSTDIRDAHAGLEESEIIIASAKVDALASSDIRIAHTDLQWFARFCRELVINPLQQRDILIIFDDKILASSGSMSPSKPEEKSEEPKKK